MKRQTAEKVSAKTAGAKRPRASIDETDDVIANIRHRNMLFLRSEFERKLLERFPDEPSRGMDRRFAESIGVSRAYYSHIKVGYRQIGDVLARDFERVSGLPVGWMDRAHGEAASADQEEQQAVDLMLRAYRHDPDGTRRALLSALHTLGSK